MSAQRDIESTLYRCARGFDDGDIDLLLDCFTADAELVSFEGTTSGRDAIRDALSARRAASGADGDQPRHLVTNVEIDLESDAAATSRAAYVLFSAQSAGITIASTGVYVDRLVNEAGAWRISRRHVRVDRR
jgi:3-phenylpropionate/cinnamic acid dioxygenase small subunit